MASLTLELVLGNDQAIYEALIASMPPGESNLTRGIVVPSHPVDKPQTLQLNNVVPNIPYIVDFVGEWNTAPTPRIYFIPTTTFQIITVALPYGPVSATVSASKGVKFSEEYRAVGEETSIPLSSSVTSILSVSVDNKILTQGQWTLFQNQRTKRAELEFVKYPLDGSAPVVLAPKSIVVTSGVRASGVVDTRQFILSVTNYAVLFRAYAKELTEYSNQPLEVLRNSISNPLSYRLATPLLTKLTTLIPADLEILTALSYKLLIKNLLHRPESEGATREILAAFSASNPIFNKMTNLSRFDSPMYRSEEIFQGYEAHVWLPNKEIERWKAFITLLANLPQLYSLKQITENEVFVEIGGRIKRYLFDFDSPLANSITTGVTYLSDCFLKLFTLGVTVESEHWLSFCQAAYILDQVMNSALSPINDPIGIKLQLPAWKGYSLSGRFDQQYTISDTHDWRFDSPLEGTCDGINRFFILSQTPASLSSVKIFIDGLLKHLYVDYRISAGGDIVSGVNRILVKSDPILIESEIGEIRPFLAPTFSGLEVKSGLSLQMLLTGVETGLDNVAFIISHTPTTIKDDPESVAIHYVTPKIANSGNPGANQYGIVSLDEGATSYDLTYTLPTVSVDYQLLVSLTIDPMPSNNPEKVTQVAHLVRTHSNTGASIDFSAPIAENTKLNWMVIETNTQTLERGTVLLSSGDASKLISFANGPYYDQVVIILQLWHLNSSYVSASQYLVSFALDPTQFLAMFSSPIEDDNYRLDYCVFEAKGGNFVEFYDAPASTALVEAHYDLNWKYWVNRGLIPDPDGYNTEFTLTFPCSDPKSVYLALDGRLLTQGADKQYIVSGNKVAFTFPPTAVQIPWAVYPVAPTGTLPSSWDQGSLNRLPYSIGEYSTGWIKIFNEYITSGDSVTIAGITFEASPTAEGRIINAKSINLGDSITWPSLHSIEMLPSDITLGTSTFNHMEHTFYEGLTVRPYSTGTLPGGLTSGAIYTIFNATLNTFNLKDSLNNAVVLSSIGTGVHTFTSQVTISGINTIPTNYNQFKAGMSQDKDAASLVEAINTHPALISNYVAKYLGMGVTTVKAKNLGNGIYNIPMIPFGSSLSCTSLVGDSAECTYSESIVRNSGFLVELNSTTDFLNIMDNKIVCTHQFVNGDSVKLSTTGVLPSGFDAGTIYHVCNATPSSFQLRLRSKDTLDDDTTPSPISEFTSLGSGSHTVHNIKGSLAIATDIDPLLNLHIDLATSTFLHENLFFDGLKVSIINIGPRTYESVTGRTTIVGSLPSGLSENIPYYILKPSSVFKADAVNTASNSIDIDNTLIDGCFGRFSTSGSLPSGIDYELDYYVINATSVSFQVSLSLGGDAVEILGQGTGTHIFSSNTFKLSETKGGTPVTLSSFGSGYHLFSSFPISENTFSHESHGFISNESVTLSSINLPSELSLDRYYIVNPTTNSFQVSEAAWGLPISFKDIGSEITITSFPHFPSGNNKQLDTTSLSTAVKNHPGIKNLVTINMISSDTIAVTAKKIGKASLSISGKGTSISVQDMSLGKEENNSLVYSTSKPCYQYKAPITTLDGISTRFWKQYGGDKFLFDYPPTVQQEGYFVSEVFKIDAHPLDSAVANLPTCNYPNGVFTQGFGTHLSETSIAVAIDSSLIISTANMPVQQQPQATTAPLVYSFSLDLISCAGQSSLMLWIDGVFQPPTLQVDFNASDIDLSIITVPNSLTEGYRGSFSTSGTLPSGIDAATFYYVKNATPTSFQVSLSVGGAAIEILSQGVGKHTFGSTCYTYTESGGVGKINLSAPLANSQHIWCWYLPMGSSCQYERVEQLIGDLDGINTDFTVPESWEDTPTLMVFLEGLFALQLQDYIVLTGDKIRYAIAPTQTATGQSLWAHYNLGLSLPTDQWRQTRILTGIDGLDATYTLPSGTTDGVTSRFMIDHMLTSELPISQDATLVFLDGLNQGGKYSLRLDTNGNPDGVIIFDSVPEPNRKMDVSFIRASTI